ncbi:hypothetical protein [Jannaschia sp. R86511]|uniref:hypothetical protein n=1 Tax=Jannaschia sp. R86511 TaxID=3093853 RepID=UPI0036D349B4
MAGPARLKVEIIGDAKSAQRALDTVSGRLGKFGKAAGAAALKIGAVGAAAVGAAAVGLIRAGEAASTANARIGNIAESMGLFGGEAGAVTDRLVKLAEATARQTGIDTNSIKATQAKLLTFKELASTADEAGGTFDRANQAALDLAAAGFGEAESNAAQLGKALNDPIKGLTALTRSGVTFTKAEKDRIAALVESNKTGEAQQLILSAIETQVGGTAVATADASDRIKVAFSQVADRLGQKLMPLWERFADYTITTIIPALERFGAYIQDTLVPKVQQLGEGFQTSVLPALQAFGDYITGTVVPQLQALGGFVQRNATTFLALGAAVATITAGIVAYNAVMAVVRTVTLVAAAAQGLLNIALNANPIGIVVLAIAGLVAALVVVYKRNETFRNAVNRVAGVLKGAAISAFNALRSAVGFLAGVFQDLWQRSERLRSILGAVGSFIGGVVAGYFRLQLRAAIVVATTAIDGIKRGAELVRTGFDRLRTGIGNLASKFRNSRIGGAFLTGLNNIKDAAERVFSAVGRVIDRIRNIQFPSIPNPLRGLLSAGGPQLATFTARPVLMTAAAGAGGLGSIGYAGGGGGTPLVQQRVVNITVTGALDPVGTARTIRQLLAADDRRTGRAVPGWRG